MPGNILTVSDRFVLRTLSPILIALFLLLGTPGLLTLSIIIGTEGFASSEPPFALYFIQKIMNFGGVPEDFLYFSAHGIPALIGAICFRRMQLTLNWVGKASFFLLLALIGVSIFNVIYLNPEDNLQARNILQGREALLALEQASEFSLRSSLTYMSFLIGFRVNISNGHRTGGG